MCFGLDTLLLYGRILDNLPVAIPQIRDDSGSNVKRYERGFPVGRTEVRALSSAVLPQCKTGLKWHGAQLSVYN